MRILAVASLSLLLGLGPIGTSTAHAGGIAEWALPIIGSGASARLGVTLQPLTEELREYFAAPPGLGVLIASVAEGSAAADAHLRAGDVLVAIDGTPVAAPGDVMREIFPAPTEATVELALLREQQPLTVAITLDGEASAYFDPLDRRSWSGLGERVYEYVDQGRAALLRRLEELERRLEQLEREPSADDDRERAI